MRGFHAANDTDFELQCEIMRIILQVAIRRRPHIEDGLHLPPALGGRHIVNLARLPVGRDRHDQRRGVQRGALWTGLHPLSGGLLELRALSAVHGYVQVRSEV